MGNYSAFPSNPYGWFDFWTGIFVGLYVNLNIRQRNADCSSRMLGFGISVAAYAKYFDGPWNNSFLPWLSLILKVAFDGYGGFYMMKTCLVQLKYSESVPWEREFRVKGPYSGDKQKDDEKELKEIKDL